jgi:exonuclease III
MLNVWRRPVGVAAALAATLVGTLVFGQVPAAHSLPTLTRADTGDEPTTMPPPAPVRVATFNTASFQRVRPAVRDIKQVAALGTEVITLQEMSSGKRRAAVQAALVDCETCVYAMYVAPGGPVPAGTPILYRKDRFTLRAAGSVKVTDATYVGPKGAGPSTIRPKFVNWVRLKDQLTKRQLYVLNNHTVPTVQAADGGPNGNTARLRIYRKHMAGLTALVRQLRADKQAPMFVTGDFNVNFRTDRVVAASIFPYATLGLVSGHASYELLGEPEEGTHVLPSGFDKRLIDQVYVIAGGAVVPTAQQILTDVSSDHRPMILETGLSYKPRLYR